MNNLNENQNLNYEQKKNNGKGVFYGVIAVATLIVAIIGATFAYFTASASSSNEALKATAAHVQVTYHEGRQLVATNLIPSKASVVAQAYANPTAYETNVANGCTHVNADENSENNVNEANPESMTSSSNWYGCTSGSPVSTGDVGTKCVDDNGYYVCAVYQFTVTNTSNVKQALTAYMQIDQNEFTTVEKKAGDTPLTENHSNGALKFMTVRSGSLINVDAIDSTNANCTNDLYAQNVTQGTKSTKFCIPDTCSAEDIQTTVQTDPCYGKTEGYSYWDADVAADGNAVSKSPLNGVFTDTSGDYYYFNTTAVPQSLLASGNQAVFNGEILPSIDRNYLSTSNKLVYMYTDSSKAETGLELGTSDNPTTPGNIYADSNGNLYTDAATCASNKEFNATCSQVYLSTTACQRYNSAFEVVDQTCYGVYGQVNSTFYIVAWLEENDKSQDDDQDKTFATTIHVTSGSLDANGGITGYMNP